MRKIRIVFAKEGSAAYLSHLDLMRTFARSFVRAKIPLRHTEGFNPHPYLSIAHPLPVGFTGECELLDCEVLTDDTSAILERLQVALPTGIRVSSLSEPELPVSAIALAEYKVTYLYDGTMPADAVDRLNALFAKPEIPVVKKGKKGPVTVNLADHFASIRFDRASDRAIICSALLTIKEAPLNPRYFTQAISDEDLKPDFSRYHRCGFLNAEGNGIC